MTFYFNKKMVLLILFLLTLVVVFVVIALGTKKETALNQNPSPTPLKYINTINKKDDAIRQNQMDFELSKQQSLFQNKYPWYNKIPPKNNSFFIMFDAANNVFYIELYPLTKSSVSLSEQVYQLKQRVIVTLEGIGVDTKTYKMEWQIYPSDLPLYPNGHY